LLKLFENIAGIQFFSRVTLYQYNRA